MSADSAVAPVGVPSGKTGSFAVWAGRLEDGARGMKLFMLLLMLDGFAASDWTVVGPAAGPLTVRRHDRLMSTGGPLTGSLR
jgi:hypothetical protein